MKTYSRIVTELLLDNTVTIPMSSLTCSQASFRRGLQRELTQQRLLLRLPADSTLCIELDPSEEDFILSLKPPTPLGYKLL